MAKQRQEFVKARVRQLGKRLAELSMVNMNNIPRQSRPRFHGQGLRRHQERGDGIQTGHQRRVRRSRGKISTNSPIGRCLLNKKVGDTAVVVTPNGKRELEILSLSTIHDEAEPEEAKA